MKFLFMKNRGAIIINDSYHEVQLYLENEPLEEGLGYICGDYVYVYRGKLKEGSKKPGIYLDKDGKHHFIHPTESEAPVYAIDNILQLDTDSIAHEIENKDQILSITDIEMINANSDAYQPTIREEDDFLKHLIKRAILDKGVNLNTYKSKLTKDATLNNLKSILKKDTKMSVVKFKEFCELLGLRWSMVIEDDGVDPYTPLEHPIKIESEDF